MNATEITERIIAEVKIAIDEGYNRFYINVDNLEDGSGFIRVLAMFELKDKILFEGTYSLDVCYDVLNQMAGSEYIIQDVTTRW